MRWSDWGTRDTSDERAPATAQPEPSPTEPGEDGNCAYCGLPPEHAPCPDCGAPPEPAEVCAAGDVLRHSGPWSSRGALGAAAEEVCDWVAGHDVEPDSTGAFMSARLLAAGYLRALRTATIRPIAEVRAEEAARWAAREDDLIESQLADMQAERRRGRVEALEEAAKVCERPRCRKWSPRECAGQIRALAEKGEDEAETETETRTG